MSAVTVVSPGPYKARTLSTALSWFGCWSPSPPFQFAPVSLRWLCKTFEPALGGKVRSHTRRAGAKGYTMPACKTYEGYGHGVGVVHTEGQRETGAAPVLQSEHPFVLLS